MEYPSLFKFSDSDCFMRQQDKDSTYISSTMTMSDFPSKASMHWTSLGWWRLFMMPISCRTFSFSFAEYALMNFPAQTFFVAFSTSLNTWPNFPLRQRQKLYVGQFRGTETVNEMCKQICFSLVFCRVYEQFIIPTIFRSTDFKPLSLSKNNNQKGALWVRCEWASPYVPSLSSTSYSSFTFTSDLMDTSL